MTALAKSIFVATPAAPSRPLVITRVVPKAAATVSPISNDSPPYNPVVIARVAPKAASSEAELIAIVDRPLNSGETVAAGFARKERELACVLAKLSVIEARAMHARLAIDAPGDVLATKFARLTADRRTRLLVFLADARRREALGGR